MTIQPRAAGTSVILEDVEPDASGNNDRQRTTLERYSIAEAEAFAEVFGAAIASAKDAVELERITKLSKAEAERDAVRRRLAELEAEIAALEGGRRMTEEELLDGLKKYQPPESPEAQAERIRRDVSRGTPFASPTDPDMPAFLRRTA